LGDSAFGFSAMEIDTCIRYSLPILIIIINNNGIYSGVEELPKEAQEIPVTALNPESRYEKMAEAFGGAGFYVKNKSELEPALKKALVKVKNG
jgi:thiamine pyrophosphate-dependent acetolactate synthase large subunit-like protein